MNGAAHVGRNRRNDAANAIFALDERSFGRSVLEDAAMGGQHSGWRRQGIAAPSAMQGCLS
jgi:hypothetical protein